MVQQKKLQAQKRLSSEGMGLADAEPQAKQSRLKPPPCAVPAPKEVVKTAKPAPKLSPAIEVMYCYYMACITRSDCGVKVVSLEQGKTPRVKNVLGEEPEEKLVCVSENSLLGNNNNKGYSIFYCRGGGRTENVGDPLPPFF